jgi:elongation factor 3
MAATAELFQKLTAAASTEERAAAAAAVAAAVKAGGPAGIKADGVVDALRAAIDDAASPLAREGGLVALQKVAEVCGCVAEPFLLELIPSVLERGADKVAPVRDAAASAAHALFAMVNPYSTADILPHLFDGMSQTRNWQTKVLALNLLTALSKTATKQVASCLHDVVPRLTDTIADAKEQVKAATREAMQAAFGTNGNRDIEKFIPVLVSCIANPVEVTDCIHQLASTTFVQPGRARGLP